MPCLYGCTPDSPNCRYHRSGIIGCDCHEYHEYRRSTGDLFGNQDTDRQQVERVEIQKRLAETRGGIADVDDLPLFTNQVDLFDKQEA